MNELKKNYEKLSKKYAALSSDGINVLAKIAEYKTSFPENIKEFESFEEILDKYCSVMKEKIEENYFHSNMTAMAGINIDLTSNDRKTIDNAMKDFLGHNFYREITHHIPYNIYKSLTSATQLIIKSRYDELIFNRPKTDAIKNLENYKSKSLDDILKEKTMESKKENKNNVVIKDSINR